MMLQFVEGRVAVHLDIIDRSACEADGRSQTLGLLLYSLRILSVSSTTIQTLKTCMHHRRWKGEDESIFKLAINDQSAEGSNPYP